MDYNSLLDLIEIGAGVYLLYLAIKMKRTGEIVDNGLITKGLDLNKAPDPQGYIDFMFPWNIGMGVLFVLCGMVSRLLAGKELYNTAITVSMVVCAICVVAYGYVTMKAQQKYLKP